ncbi:MAG: hemolysin D, partial [Planctomycetota bacterium]
FAPQKISLRELYQFIGMLFRSSLLVSEASGQGRELLKRKLKQEVLELKASWTNVLAIRFRGFDPDRLLNELVQWLGWFFTWPAFLAVLLIAAGAGSLIVAQFETFQNKLPAFEAFFSSSNWLWLVLVMAFTKVLHEFGHGLACKKFGGQCHEMGFMLLVLMPCLYANVSDSWLLKSKWKRALIAAAGMYVELVLASICVFVWWFTTEGLVNQLAFNIIFVSSITTVLFNANPLLRYDGYYVLSDLLEIPNLRSKATKILQRTSAKWLLGIDANPDPFLPVKSRWMFGFYAVAAACYRWIITFAIFWFVYRLLEPYGLKLLGQVIAISAIYGLVGQPLVKLYQFFFSAPGRLGTVKISRACASFAVLMVLVAGILWVPIPRYIVCSFYLQAQDAEVVYVEVPGTLEEIFVEPNQRILQGQPIVRLASRDLDQQVAMLRTQAEAAKVNYDNLVYGTSRDRAFGAGKEVAQVEYSSAVQSLQDRQLDFDRLIVRSPLSGILIEPTRIKHNKDDQFLQSWEGSPLEKRNLHAALEKGTQIGIVLPDDIRLTAFLVVDQSDIEFVQPGQNIDLIVNADRGQKLRSKVETVSPNELEEIPKSVTARYGGKIITQTGQGGREIPRSTKYLVSANLDTVPPAAFVGATGKAKILTGYQTVADMIWRIISHTVQFEL